MTTTPATLQSTSDKVLCKFVRRANTARMVLVRAGQDTTAFDAALVAVNAELATRGVSMDQPHGGDE